ncbi:MAG: hypothetical protein IT318_15195 [Anaerolineales bacterium]|nr:hypothetical protein [Anaerolineales bacterium]
MISIANARALRAAGLSWQPAQLDFFALPEHGLDERLFVITDLPAALARIQGQAMMTFEGAVEWALDYVAAGEALWMPTESQLRDLLTARLPAEPAPDLALTATPSGWRCALSLGGRRLSCEAADASDAYAAALLEALRASG